MRADDLVMTEGERQIAADGLVSSQRTDAVNSGIVGNADKSASTLKADLYDRVGISERDGWVSGSGRHSDPGSDNSGFEDSFFPDSGVPAPISPDTAPMDPRRGANGAADGWTGGKETGETVHARLDVPVRAGKSLASGAITETVQHGPSLRMVRGQGIRKAVGTVLSGSEFEGADDMVYDSKAAVSAVRRIGRKLAGHSAKAKAGRSAVDAATKSGHSGLAKLSQKRYLQPKGRQAHLSSMQVHRHQVEAIRQAGTAKSAAVAAASGKTAAAGTAVGSVAPGGGAAAVGASGGGCLLGLFPALLALLLLLSIINAIVSAVGGSAAQEAQPLTGNERIVAEFLMEKGLDELHTAAIMGNIYKESGFDPAAMERKSDGSLGEGRGLCQWSFGRRDRLEQWAADRGVPWSDMDLQLDLLWYEYAEGGRFNADQRAYFESLTSIREAVLYFGRIFEAPNEAYAHWDERVSQAQIYYASLNASSYVQAALDIASDDSHGYSMDRRMFNPDVDCSSFVYYALLESGYTTEDLGGYPFTTFNMGTILVNAGFEEHAFNGMGELQAGDILVADTHTEIYIGNGQNVGAHDDYDGKPGDSSGNEVSVGGYYDGGWHHYYRKAA